MSISKFLFSLAKTPIGDYIVGNTFEKFSKVLPVDRVFENDKVIAFWHPKPFWEKHILIVPKKKIKNIVGSFGAAKTGSGCSTGRLSQWWHRLKCGHSPGSEA